MLSVALLNLNSYAKKNQDSIYINYLNQVKQDFFNSPALITDSIAQSHQYFFINENHGYHANYKIALKLIKELKAKTDFTYMISESDLSEVKTINRFLETGDTLYLKNYINSFKSTFGWCHEKYAYYKALYQFNQSCENKLRFIGIDVAQDVEGNIKLISSIRSKYNLETNYSYDHGKSFKLDSTDIEYTKQLLQTTDITFFSKEDAFIHNYCLNNALNFEKCMSDSIWDQTRDSLMFENHQKLISFYGLEKEKMVGIFGRNHGYQSNESDIDWLASRIKKQASKSTYTFALFYTDSEQMIPQQFIPGILKTFRSKKKLYYNLKITNDDSKIANYMPGIEHLKEVTTPDSKTYFNLDSNHSPYKKAHHMAYMPDNTYTTDCFQSIILIRNSKATSPFGANRK
jgi:hypothetical protein